jgi:hypothetical protein
MLLVLYLYPIAVVSPSLSRERVLSLSLELELCSCLYRSLLRASLSLSRLEGLNEPDPPLPTCYWGGGGLYEGVRTQKKAK